MVRVVDCHAGVLGSNPGGPRYFPLGITSVGLCLFNHYPTHLRCPVTTLPDVKSFIGAGSIIIIADKKKEVNCKTIITNTTYFPLLASQFTQRLQRETNQAQVGNRTETVIV